MDILARGQAGWQPSRASESGARAAELGVRAWVALPWSLTERTQSERGVQGQGGVPFNVLGRCIGDGAVQGTA